MDWRVRLLGRLLRRTSVTRMTPDDIVAAQRPMARNALTDRMMGAPVAGVESSDRVLPTTDGPLPVRVHRPVAAPPGLPLVLHFHGGGWVLGSAGLSDWVCTTVSGGVDAVVVSVDYRLAPAHRFPAAVDDCVAALEWAVEHAAELGADGGRVAVMGDSAGANLAAVVCLTARDRGGPAIRHQSLIYPVTDAAEASPSYRTNAAKPVLTPGDMVAFRRHYLGPDGDARDPRAAPLLAADHSGLPPALIQVAEHDPLHDDGTRYAEALRDAGVTVRLTGYDGMPHGYLSMPWFCRSAPRALAEVVTEQRAVLHPR